MKTLKMMDIDEKLDLILKNQEIINENQKTLYNLITKSYRSDSKDFLLNYLADVASVLTFPNQ